MRYFDPASIGCRASILAFGCAPAMGFHDRATSLRALAAAWDHGVTFFDLARSYGYGQAESLFAGFARGKRDRLVIATKFGITPDGSPRANAVRLLRGGLGGIRHMRFNRGGESGRDDAFAPYWSPERVRAGVRRSLRELQTGYVDLLLLHSPPENITLRAEVFGTLDDMVREGLIRSYGLSTDAGRATRCLAAERHSIQAIQHAWCPVTGVTETVANPPETVILNHVFGGRGTLPGAGRLLAAVRRRTDIDPETQSKLGGENPAAVLADVLINGALTSAGAQCAVVSMFSVPHIAANCAVVEKSRFTPAEVRWLTRALESGRGQAGMSAEPPKAEG